MIANAPSLNTSNRDVPAKLWFIGPFRGANRTDFRKAFAGCFAYLSGSSGQPGSGPFVPFTDFGQASTDTAL